jgi:hypothetical protein
VLHQFCDRFRDVQRPSRSTDYQSLTGTGLHPVLSGLPPGRGRPARGQTPAVELRTTGTHQSSGGHGQHHLQSPGRHAPSHPTEDSSIGCTSVTRTNAGPAAAAAARIERSPLEACDAMGRLRGAPELSDIECSPTRAMGSPCGRRLRHWPSQLLSIAGVASAAPTSHACC